MKKKAIKLIWKQEFMRIIKQERPKVDWKEFFKWIWFLFMIIPFFIIWLIIRIVDWIKATYKVIKSKEDAEFVILNLKNK